MLQASKISHGRKAEAPLIRLFGWHQKENGPNWPSRPGPVNCVTGDFPYRHKEMGGYQVYMGQAPYSLIEAMKGNQPMIGHPKLLDHNHKIARMTYDLSKHLNAQDRYSALSLKQYWQLMFTQVYNERYWLWALMMPLSAIAFNFMFFVRREPPEHYCDSEEYWYNFDLYAYGKELDHHQVDHMIEARFANKWGWIDPHVHH
mmetsp:Transcript_10648/g.26047  ORF Transcript_10648/g.26047 Transcript_10648/m.26047 type:complete len:202 (+) Transcript_10648:196-801(+)